MYVDIIVIEDDGVAVSRKSLPECEDGRYVGGTKRDFILTGAAVYNSIYIGYGVTPVCIIHNYQPYTVLTVVK